VNRVDRECTTGQSPPEHEAGIGCTPKLKLFFGNWMKPEAIPIGLCRRASHRTKAQRRRAEIRASRRCPVERNQILDWTDAVEQAVERRRNKVIVPGDGAL